MSLPPPQAPSHLEMFLNLGVPPSAQVRILCSVLFMRSYVMTYYTPDNIFIKFGFWGFSHCTKIQSQYTTVFKKESIISVLLQLL